MDFLTQMLLDLEDIRNDIEYDLGRSDSVAQKKVEDLIKLIEDKMEEPDEV
jgi:hypothetical protein